METQPTKRRRRRREQQKRNRRRKALVIALAAAAVLLLAAACWGIAGAAKRTQPAEIEATIAPSIAPTQTPQLEIDPNAGAQITPTPAPQEPGVAIPGWGSMTIPAGVTEVATSMQNPEANDGWYYLTFELRLKETDEVLFTTGLIPPGQYCNKVTLSRALEPGEYAAVIHVQPYRIADLTPTNNADMETTLIVE